MNERRNAERALANILACSDDNRLWLEAMNRARHIRTSYAPLLTYLVIYDIGGRRVAPFDALLRELGELS